MNEQAPFSFMVTDPDDDAPDGAIIYVEDHDAWYERIRDWWYQIAAPEVLT